MNHTPGRSRVNWRTANLEHLQLALTQYEKRIAEATADYLNLDAKARWVFGLDLTVLLATAGYLLANIENFTQFEAWSLLALLASLSTGLWFAGQAITLQEDHGSGITPKNINIHEWTEFLTGGRRNSDCSAQCRLAFSKSHSVQRSRKREEISNP